MSEFKKGDTVRCITGDGEPGQGQGWKLGYEYEVTRVENYGRDCFFGGLNGHGVYQDYLELVSKSQEAKFNVGDEVEYFQNTDGYSMCASIGETLTIKSREKDVMLLGSHKGYEVCCESGTKQSVRSTDIRVISELKTEKNSTTGEKTMKKTISTLFKNTDEALLVEKHLGTGFAEGTKGYIESVILKPHTKELLAEANRLEKEAEKE